MHQLINMGRLLSCWMVVLVIILLCLGKLQAGADGGYVATLPEVERAAVCQVLGAINPEVEWSCCTGGNTTTGVDLCTEGPHGIVCEVDEEDPSLAHVRELNLGYVSDYSNNPSCSAGNASFSPAITRLPYLSKLFFYRCFTDGRPVVFPDYLTSLGSQLQELVFHSNPSLAGPLPEKLGKLAGLRRLIVSGSSVNGSLPAAIGELVNLQQLDLSNNGIDGEVPASIGELRELVVLDLSRNSFSGGIPAELGLLPELSKLDLSYNELTGPIPPSFANASKSLEMLDLSRNKLNGGLPLFLGSLGSLKTLRMAGNPIGGSLPDIWKGLGALVGLDLSVTGLVGEIPDSLGELGELSYLALDHNHLSGSIPLTLALLPSVHHIDLSYNHLSGLVPFSAAMVGRLGERLKMDGNKDLCVNLGLLVTSLGERIGVEGCRHFAPPSSKASSSSDLIMALQKDSSSARNQPWIGQFAIFILLAMLLLLP